MNDGVPLNRALTPSSGIRLPFFYGWVLVAIAFVTMAVGVNARTAFSLLFSAILDEFGWGRGVTAGAFWFGFLASALVTPFVGLMDLRGPRSVIELGVVTMGVGLLLASLVHEPWQLYLTLGALAGGGVNCLAYTGQSLYLTNWFVRRRGLALSIAFAGVGIGSITILPWQGWIIQAAGWRSACVWLGILVLVLLGPLNLLLKKRPEDIGLAPDGMPSGSRASACRAANVVDHPWATVDWTLGRALRTARFWWMAAGYFCGLFSWYAVQVHQTKYLVEIGFAPSEAAWALGLVSLVAIPGQIAFGHLSDRIGRQWVWMIGNVGFVICYVALVLLRKVPTAPLLVAMVLAQGTLGYSLTSVMGAIPAEIFEGRHSGSIFGTVMVAAILGGAAGPWITGVVYDATGSYSIAFWIAAGCSAVSILAIWLAAPGKVRTVDGRTRRYRE